MCFVLFVGVGRAAPSKLDQISGSSPVVKPISPSGFQDIHFGEPIDSVFQKLKAKFQLKQDAKGVYTGADGVRFETFEGALVLQDYLLSTRRFKLAFRFNKNGKFFRYELTGANKSADAFATTVKDEADFLSRVFEKKFGPTFNKNSPNIFDVKPGFVTAVWQWPSETHTVFTGIGQTTANEYYVTAVVADNALAEEKQRAVQKEPTENIDEAAKKL
jgi:hypothetical protein